MYKRAGGRRTVSRFVTFRPSAGGAGAWRCPAAERKWSGVARKLIKLKPGPDLKLKNRQDRCGRHARRCAFEKRDELPPSLSLSLDELPVLEVPCKRSRSRSSAMSTADVWRGIRYASLYDALRYTALENAKQNEAIGGQIRS